MMPLRTAGCSMFFRNPHGLIYNLRKGCGIAASSTPYLKKHRATGSLPRLSFSTVSNFQLPPAILLFRSERIEQEAKILGPKLSHIQDKVVLQCNGDIRLSDDQGKALLTSEDCKEDLAAWGIPDVPDICVAFYQSGSKLEELSESLSEVLQADGNLNSEIRYTLSSAEDCDKYLAQSLRLSEVAQIRSKHFSSAELGDEVGLPTRFWVHLNNNLVPVLTPSMENATRASLRGNIVQQRLFGTEKALEYLKAENEYLSNCKEKVDRAVMYRKVFLHSILTMASIGQFGALAYLTIQYEWDFMEPVCYFLGAGLSCIGAFYIAYYSEDDTWGNLSKRIQTRLERRQAGRFGLDISHLEEIDSRLTYGNRVLDKLQWNLGQSLDKKA